MSQDWTEKYRPDSLSKVIGNPKAVSDMKNWADSWKKGIPQKRAIVLMGSPGTGKTSAAIALAKDMKWDVVEMNASDQRTGDTIRNIAIKGANFNTFMNGEYLSTREGRRKLIILDEADNLFGNADRGALPVISELIKTAKQPVILIVNDFYALSRKSAAIKTDTLQITFMRSRSSEIMKALDSIAKTENITIDREALKKIAENSNGDMRAAVRNLESLALGKDSVTGDDAEKLSDRIIRKDIYDLMNAVFREKDAMKARRMIMDVDETPDHIMLWIDENMPFEFRDKGDLMRGYERLSRADIFLGRVSRRQYYGFWSYSGDMMSAGVNIAKRSNMSAHDRFRFPTYLMKMSRSRSVRTLKNNVCLKLSSMLHTSANRVSNDVLPSLKIMLRNNSELAKSIVTELDLETEEIAFLLDAKIDSKEVKDAMPPVVKNLKGRGSAEDALPAKTKKDVPATVADAAAEDTTTVKKIEPKDEVRKGPQPGQKSLFQF